MWKYEEIRHEYGYKGYTNASMVLGIIGICVGLYTGVQNLSVGLILLYVFLWAWVLIGIPYSWYYIKLYYKWWERWCSGCITFFIVIIINFYIVWIALAIIIFLFCPIISIRFFIDYRNYEKRRFEEETQRKLKSEEDAKLAKKKAEEDAARAEKQAEIDAISMQRQSYAEDVKNKAKMIEGQCNTNKKIGDQTNLQPVKYHNVDMQEAAWNVLYAISIQMQKLENTIVELKEER